MSKVWVYKNHVTQSEMECNDLNFMVDTLTNFKDVEVPHNCFVDVILKGQTEWVDVDDEGNQRKHTISEKVEQENSISI